MKAFLILLFITCTAVHVVHGQINSDVIKTRLNTMAEEFPENTSFSICVINNGDIEYYGAQLYNGNFKSVDLKDSLFEIGSLTKVFTSSVLADMAVNDGLKLSKKINKSFAYKLNNKIKLNYESLSNHTSGVYRLPSNILMLFTQTPDNPYSNYTYELLDNYLENSLQLENKSNEKYSYSNLGAGILAYTLALKDNLGYPELLDQRILSKYGLTNTGYDLKASIPGLNAEGDTLTPWEFNALIGAGGLISSVSDLSKFVEAQFNSEDEVLRLTREETFSISSNMSIGLGWHIIDPDSENKKFWHNGGTGGYTSSLSFRTSNQTGIIILTNISAFNPNSAHVDELCFELLDELM